MVANHPTSLVNEQTSVQFSSLPTYGVLLRHSCEPQFAAALRIYSLLDGGPEHGRARRLRECRQNAWFCRHIDTGEVRVASSACSLRWCPVCGNARRNYVTHSVAEWLGNADHPKLLTLTLKHTHAPLDHQVTHLYDFFRELRRRKEFKKAVTGGVWFFQIKKSRNDGMWHPHIHALITGRYLAQRKLRNMWIQITYGSEVVDIRSIHNPQKVANDAARYATSPGDLTHLPPDDGMELVDSLHGRRICGTWGIGRGVSLRPKPTSEPGKWKSLGNWSTVLGMYETSADARAIVLSWKTGIPLPSDISCINVDKAINRMTQDGWANYDFETILDHERSPPCKNQLSNTYQQ